ncbi:hypothetical protein H3Z85_02235 [Chryseobacterium indologenes]|uniref:Lipoprotein n=1 Tax=Chryseobacterium indologenes TaxID=253 RepID=A0AAD0YW67_CHRID|nr:MULTISPECIES: DUF5074 domain-containing protein [Chryseobacterium]ASE62341.1 hypothetical protein CEQ15_12970 [Chryseobacterium indologenes]AYZ34737.1 hypothetical protein EGY07_03720 [Chryseobacterium indologenes]AZB18051.1 hypothetical protein EG352_09835 [Chryseobacterium indologenes]MBF6643321.1 hypothetical protein [Chryseobacterium indologenes]MBU3046745.1 hypothetical protein [Chryseobacterium indologenes]
MNIRKILPLALLSALLFSVSCSNDIDLGTDTNLPTSYEKGILIANEGGFTTPTADVSFLSNTLAFGYNNIYTNTNKEELGKVLQSIGLNGDRAYLVSNIPNKIDIVNRTNFKKITTVTANLDNARYIAFSGGKYYVTNNNFTTVPNVRKVNVYNVSDNAYVSSINFPRYAEKIVEAEGNIIVQTDGVGYDFSTTPATSFATGYTITVVKPSTNTAEQPIVLPNVGIIRDLISYKGAAYVLASDNTNSYIYKINSSAGTYTTTTITGIPQGQKLRADDDKFYLFTSSKEVFKMNIGSTVVPTVPLLSLFGNVYGFDVIDGKLYASDASFTSDSKVYVYDTAGGNLLKNFIAGIGTNGFYKN